MRTLVKAVVFAGVVVCAILFAHRFTFEYGQVTAVVDGASKSRMMSFFGAFLASTIALGLLCAFYFTQFAGEFVERFILIGRRTTRHIPELQEAELLYRKGDFLQAVRLMRKCVEKYPDEWHIMRRIAEIYEHHLNNPLAAALEYEELLKKKIPSESWGWAAIHLSTLYLKLTEPDKAINMLRRIVNEHGQTLAARKARRRLTRFEGGKADLEGE